MENSYWRKYWEESHNPESSNLQVQVARTRMGEPISQDSWVRTCEYVRKNLQLNMSDTVLDACGGNGLFAKEFRELCERVVVVDINLDLLNVLNESALDIHTVHSELIEFLQSDKEKYTKILFYAGIQYFSEEQVLKIFRLFADHLMPGGIILIGDIPDIYKRDSFLKEGSRYMSFFENLSSGKPNIGSWFTFDWLRELSNFSGFSECELLLQPDYQIYSDFRFDVRIKK